MNYYARHRARKLAIQAIYQWQMNQEPVENIAAQFLAEANPKKIDLEYFTQLLREVTQHVAELDAKMMSFLDRGLDDLDMVELAVLRLAIYELAHHPEVPYKVVINEALELTKAFGSVDGFKYVNGILDRIAHQLRHSEIKT
jgi:transcription antitermination protein NusB